MCKKTLEQNNPNNVLAKQFNFGYLSPSISFKLFLSFRLCAALWSNISDCDETFNYWEPLHFLMYKYGYQTWEYSPQYALRSYFYILIYSVPMALYKLIQPNKVLLFFSLRCVMSVWASFVENNFYKGLIEKYKHWNYICISWLWIILFAPGMFISSTAFLPSTFSMYLIMHSYGLWWQSKENLPYTIVYCAMACIVGWPFAGALAFPLLMDIVFNKKLFIKALRWSTIALVIIMLPMVFIDSIYYGKLVIAPLNLVIYNLFSGKGPELYGTEPLSYYLVNLFLNFNVAFVLSLLTFILYIFSTTCDYLNQTEKKCPVTYIKQNSVIYRNDLLAMSPFYLWIAIFFAQPHKEERFMFPCYGFLVLNAALSLSYVTKMMSKLLPKLRNVHFYVLFLFFGLFIPLAISRILAQVKNYHSVIDLYTHLYSQGERLFYPNLSKEDFVLKEGRVKRDRNVCVGKEWHRFPSHFFLPYEWKLQFIKSEFRGQLPKFYEHGSNATRVIPSHMNDLNLEEPSRYINIDKCDILIDLSTARPTFLEPDFSLNNSAWYLDSSYSFIDASRSNSFFRAFYWSFVNTQYVKYNRYNLLINKQMIKYQKVI